MNYRTVKVSERLPGKNKDGDEFIVIGSEGACSAYYQLQRRCMAGPRLGECGRGFVDTYNKLPIDVTEWLEPIEDKNVSVVIIWKDGTYKTVDKNSAWEFENDSNWLVTIKP